MLKEYLYQLLDFKYSNLYFMWVSSVTLKSNIRQMIKKENYVYFERRFLLSNINKITIKYYM